MRGKLETRRREEYVLVPLDVERASAHILGEEPSEMQSNAYVRVFDVYARISCPQSTSL